MWYNIVISSSSVKNYEKEEIELSKYLLPHPPIIVPSVGRGEEAKALETVQSMERVGLEIKENKPEVLVIITPHGSSVRDGVVFLHGDTIDGDLRRFGCDKVSLSCKIDDLSTQAITERLISKGINAILYDSSMAREYYQEFKLDHGALVPLYFIDKHYRDYSLIHVTYGLIPPSKLREVGKTMSQVLKGKRVTYIASGDLSHKLKEDGPYGYADAGPIFDSQLISFLQRGERDNILNYDVKKANDAGECGLRSLQILLGTFGDNSFVGDLYSYEFPFGVGYAVMNLKEVENGH